MTVHQLREMLASLRPVFESAGASKVSTDLAAFTTGLNEFDGKLTLTAFLKLAKDGQKPPKPPPSPKLSVDELAAELSSIHDRPRDPMVTPDVIEATIQKIKPLSKPDVTKVAAAIGLTAVAKLTKDKILEAIRTRVAERRDAALKNDMIGGRPSEPPSDPEQRPERGHLGVAGIHH